MIAWLLVGAIGLVTLALAYALADLRQKHDALMAQFRQAVGPRVSNNVPASRRDVSQRECYDSLRKLGFSSMQEYRASEIWRRIKNLYHSSDYPRRCLVCGSRDYDLHHRTYARLGKEELFDLVPLCRHHHDCLHELLDGDPALCVKDTHDYLPLLMYEDYHAGAKAQSANKRPDAMCNNKRRRAGRAWTADEDAELLRGFAEHMAIEQLAERLQRGVRAVEVRLFKLGKLSPGRTKKDPI